MQALTSKMKNLQTLKSRMNECSSCLNSQFTEVATTQDNSVDWAEIAQAFPPEILQECSTWVKITHQESTDIGMKSLDTIVQLWSI